MVESNSALQAVRETRFLISRVDDWIYDEMSPYVGKRVLEIGCGLGNLLSRLKGLELVVGIDSDEESIRRLQENCVSQAGIIAIQADITDPDVRSLAEMDFDTLISLNVLEHVADDGAALHNMRELLKPGGHLILVVPAHSWLFGSMDRSIGHYRRYDVAGLSTRLSEAGFAPLHTKHINALGAMGWWINGRILKRSVPPAGQLRLFNMVVPAIRPIEDRLRPPMGISLLAVAR